MAICHFFSSRIPVLCKYIHRFCIEYIFAAASPLPPTPSHRLIWFCGTTSPHFQTKRNNNNFDSILCPAHSPGIVMETLKLSILNPSHSMLHILALVIRSEKKVCCFRFCRRRSFAANSNSADKYIQCDLRLL